MSSVSASRPLYDAIHEKLTAALAPTSLDIIDNSHLHAGHAAMKGLNPKETHFDVRIVSNAFQGKPLVARHQLIYKLLDVELKEKGLHALQITAKTEAESNK
ncbi:UNVERIFIED_CONTAM: BolA-like protein 1 [Siphonaria sp. JEL0065]|nr:BolA-like protein 1 [Siphonaria sp. JEL0065]